jgi:uncharacterized protein
MSDLLVALGLLAAIEGVLYAAAPGFMKRLLLQLETMSENSLRIGGLVAMAAGVILIWLVRG